MEWNWILVLILVVAAYQTIALVLAHREKMAELKLGVKPEEDCDD